MNKKFNMVAAAIALASSSALAGSPEPTVAEPPVAAPAATSPDWTGFYVGGQIGIADIDAKPGASADGLIGGLTGGYDWDLGKWVVGVGADYDFTNFSIAGADVESIWRLKLRGGYKLGNGLAYGTAGYGHTELQFFGDDGGYFVGAGYEHLISEKFSLGGEVLYNDIHDFAQTISDLDIITVQVRAAYRF